MPQQAGSPVLSVASSSSPSYSNNSSLADIAARVVEEFRAENENDEDSDEFLYVGDLFCGLGGEDLGKEDIAAAKGLQDNNDEEQNKDGDDDEQDEDEFEFAFVPRDAELSLISTADQIFYNGQIRPVFPIFNPNYWEAATAAGGGNSSSMCNSSLLLMSSSGDEQQQKVSATPQTMIRLPLRKLLLSEDQETPSSSSCSTSEADELEGIPEGTYCVWRPTAVKDEASPGKCKKSNSTGWRWRSSKRWRLRDLVHRSNSHGKDTFVFLKKGEDMAGATQSSKTAAKSKPNLKHYTKNRSGDKRRHSYLPYRQHLVGFFANVNGFSKNLQPF
ncbi:PREDICTED: uncharacterized protein LOC109149171 [Ipomoea nil]|uniref:uncharacterized protein LOC109149171 n=1 Tax=Ipomoea nil TaxID=35883 RepID=UPI0009015101|nr:PREDICTED: uncharacterized protein LOC109149171 [Ipomoea nil]